MLALSGVGVCAREPRFERGLLRLVDRGHGDIDRRGGVVLGLAGPALQLGGVPLRLPVGDLSARRRLLLADPVLHVGLRRGELGLILLDAIAHPIQMALHVLFDVRLLRVDLRFQPFQTAVGHRELLAKIFAELIDALAHVMSPVPCTTPPGLVHRNKP